MKKQEIFIKELIKTATNKKTHFSTKKVNRLGNYKNFPLKIYNFNYW